MSPVSIVFETCRSWLRILSAALVIMGFIAALPDGAGAAGRSTGSPTAAPTERPTYTTAAQLLPAVHLVEVVSPSIVTRVVSFDIARLPQSAFGDDDDSSR